jgi:hypothetical protein
VDDKQPYNTSNMPKHKRKYKKRAKRNRDSTSTKTFACLNGLCGQVLPPSKVCRITTFTTLDATRFRPARQRFGNNAKKKLTSRTPRRLRNPTWTAKMMLPSLISIWNTQTPNQQQEQAWTY